MKIAIASDIEISGQTSSAGGEGKTTTVKDKWIRIGFTAENSYAVSELFRTRGLLR